MDRSDAIDLLPQTYAEALRLADAGLEQAIPERLGVPPEAAGPLLRLARAKLAALLEPRATTGTERPSDPARSET